MSRIFESGIRNQIQNNVIEKLNTVELMNKATANSPRAVGDAVQKYLEENFQYCIPADLLKDFSSDFARRSMADFAFSDIDGNYYAVDSKTHNLGTAFNMPNLTSVERLSKFYKNPNNYFSILMVSYEVHEEKLSFTDCKFIPIEFLDWSCLTIGALGWGQIQIADSNHLTVNDKTTRKEWMLQLCKNLDSFYPNEIEKITKRIDYFSEIQKMWNQASE